MSEFKEGDVVVKIGNTSRWKNLNRKETDNGYEESKETSAH